MVKEISSNCDLNISFNNSDIEELLSKERLTLSIPNRSQKRIFPPIVPVTIKVTKQERALEIRELARCQLLFPFEDKDYPLNQRELIQIVGYEITLDRTKLKEHIEIVRKNICSEDCPFWGRGIQYYVHLDRIHIHYNPT